MYKSFLSLRYLRRRRTNWIGTAGITIAVAALILILSIMSGFLAESRKHLVISNRIDSLLKLTCYLNRQSIADCHWHCLGNSSLRILADEFRKRAAVGSRKLPA